MAKTPGFKFIILLTVSSVYMLSMMVVFFLFNQYYTTNIKTKFMENNAESANIAISILEDEKEEVRKNAAEIVRDYPLQYAMIRNVNLYYSNISEDLDKIKIKDMDKLGYMKIVSKLKQMLNASSFGVEGEKAVEIYDEKIALIAKTSNLTEEETDTKDENYLELIKENVEAQNIEGGRASIDAVGMVVKKNGILYIKGIDDVVSSLSEEKSSAQGIVIVTKKINQDMLKVIKKIVGKEVFLITDNKISYSTVYIEENTNKNINKELENILTKNGEKYIEMKIEGRNLGINFVPIEDFEGKPVAYMGIAFYVDELEKIVKNSSTEFVRMAAIFSIILLLVLMGVLWKLFEPLNAIIAFIREIAHGNYKRRFTKKLGWEMEMITKSIENLADEVMKREEELMMLNADLENKVHDRTRDLEKSNRTLEVKSVELEEKGREVAETNKELYKAIDELRVMQKQLVEAEKMASLGGIVDGVANEINNPVCDSLKASSYIENELNMLKEKIFLKSINEDNVEKAVNSIEKNTEILSECLGKISSVINSFKQFSDEYSESDEKVFNVKKYIDEISASLYEKISKTKIKMEIYCEKDITMNSHPGALYHILKNLISNSAAHAFSWNEEGEIIIDIRKNRDKIILSYYDNGKGMEQKVKENIFEPFFTTAREKGKAGLGMSIIYNIVTQTLKGVVAVESEPDKGTKIIIEMPIYIEK